MDPKLHALIEEQRAIIQAIDRALDGTEPEPRMLAIPVVAKAWASLFAPLESLPPLDALDVFARESGL